MRFEWLYNIICIELYFDILNDYCLLLKVNKIKFLECLQMLVSS